MTEENGVGVRDRDKQTSGDEEGRREINFTD